ncbi:MAG: hypothetical protein LBN27_12085 [Prevotellaceae bacterium]|jgi:hypothetical protein|nr:hypothetical protein [Prevotellaceae bacterium]
MIYLIILLIIAIISVLIIVKNVIELLRNKIKLSTEIASVYLAIRNNVINEKYKFSEKELHIKIMSVKNNINLYGSKKLKEKFKEWEDNINTDKRLWNWIELMTISKNDIYIDRKKITPDEIFQSLLASREDAEKLKKEWNVT